MTFLDLFAGYGGFRLGMEQAGHKCVGFCEWDKFAQASYISMHLLTEEQRSRLAAMDLKKRQKEIMKDEYKNGEWFSPDVRSIRADNVPRCDCWCFGAPCQDFSVAGKRAGLDGDRSSLVREVFRIIGEMRSEDRPEWLIYENVKGMLSSNKGLDFLAILLEMDKLGYDAEWFVFNSKYHGVPQNRERVYTIGHFRARGSRPKVFPICGTNEKNSADIDIIGHRDGYRRNTQVFSPTGGVEALDTATGGGRGHHTAIPIRGIDYNKGGQLRDVANTVTTRNNLAGVTNIKQDGTAVYIPIGCIDRQGRLGKEVSPKEDAPTLRAQAHGNEPEICIPVLNTAIPVTWYDKYNCYIAIRKLTPKECFRLQGVPDEYFEKAKFVNSDSQLYKQAGNAVTVNVVYEIGKRLKEIEECENEHRKRKASYKVPTEL